MNYFKVSALVPCMILIVFSGCNDKGRGLDTVESIYQNMVSIPAGSFLMGCSGGDMECYDNEYPQHTVFLSSFKISAYEVTQGQWQKVMGSNPSFYKSCGSDCPVEQVSWDDIKPFIDALSYNTGMNYRLCTEAEWEYAARAGSTTKYYCGDDVGCLDDIAWYWDNSDGTTHPVGQKTPNAWGLYDMSGDVAEWVQDWYDEEYYSSSPSDNPQGPESDNYHFRVLRGGSLGQATDANRSSARGAYYPCCDDSWLGFRLCLP